MGDDLADNVVPPAIPPKRPLTADSDTLPSGDNLGSSPASTSQGGYGSSQVDNHDAVVREKTSLANSEPGNRASDCPETLAEKSTHELQSNLVEAYETTEEVLSELDRERRENERLRKDRAELMELAEALDQNVTNLRGSLERLNGELKQTKNELTETRSHILSLQPYVKDITPEEIGRDFDDLYGAVLDWVERWLSPVFDDPDRSKAILEMTRKNALKTAGIKARLKPHRDLLRATCFADTNQDVIVGSVMRFLHHEVFSKTLYDTAPDLIANLQTIEESMRTNVEPKRDLFAIRNWRAEAYISLLSHPDFKGVSETRCRALTVELGKPLIFLTAGSGHSPGEVYRSLDADVVRPALKLQEKIQTSIHHFYFEMNSYVYDGPDNAATTAEILGDLDKLDCEDIFNNRKRFNPAKLSRPMTANELLHLLYPICVTCPRLMMRQVGRGEILKDPAVVRKQKTLIAWGSSEYRKDVLDREPPTLLYTIYHAKSGRGAEGGLLRGKG